MCVFMSPVSSPSPELSGRSPLFEVWSIAWPTVLTMTSYTVMQFVDKLMVAQVGATELAAQGNGGMWAFTPIAFAMGVLTVVNTYVSQNLGAGRPERGPQYAWAAIWLSLMIWLVVLIPWALTLPWFFSLDFLGHSEELQRMETGYGQILLAGAAIMMAGRGIHHFYFGLHRPKVVTISAICGNIVNVLANYALIFGSAGIPALGLPGVPFMPALGVYGAAIGTVLGTLVEFAIPMAIFLSRGMQSELKSRDAWRPRWKPMRELITLGSPAAMQFGNEIICWTIFMTVLVGTFGELHLAAGWAALSYMHLSFMPALGFSVAVNSLVGKYIGAGQPDVAAARARLGLKLALSYMTVCALGFFFFRHQLISIFAGGANLSPEDAEKMVSIGAKLMICAAFFQTADAFGVVYSGALRGAGDTLWPSIVTVVYSWLFIVLGGFMIITFWPELESVGPWIAAAVYITIYGITMTWRFESGRWRSIRLLDTETTHTAGPITGIAPATQADQSIRDLPESEAAAHTPRP